RHREERQPARKQPAIEIEVVERLGAGAQVTGELEFEVVVAARMILADVGEAGRARDGGDERQREHRPELHGASRSSFGAGAGCCTVCCAAATPSARGAGPGKSASRNVTRSA